MAGGCLGNASGVGPNHARLKFDSVPDIADVFTILTPDAVLLYHVRHGSNVVYSAASPGIMLADK